MSVRTGLKVGGVRISPAQLMAPANVYHAAAAAFAVALSFGYQIGFSSPAIPKMMKAGLLDTESGSWFGSVATVGGLMGCPLGGWFVERFGRKKALFSTAVPYALGWLAIAKGSTALTLFGGRILTGISSGMTTVVAPLYVAETSTKELRGMLGSGVQLFITIGIFMVYALGTIMGFRMLATVGFIIPLISIILIARVPETPRFHLIHKRRTEAARSLAWLRGSGVDVEDEIRDMEESFDAEDNFSFSEFMKPELFRPLKVACGLMILQQLSGINVIMFYTVSIFESAGFKEYGGSQATMFIGGVQVVFTVVACVLMDKAGRRALLYVASLGMAGSCFAFSYYYYSTEGAEDNDLTWLAVSSVVVYVISFSLGMGPIPMLLMSEIFPVRARGSASAVCAIISWGSAFLVTKEFAFFQEMMGSANVFAMFGLFCLLCVLFVFRLVPETKGKSLEDIELYFLGRAIRGI